MQGDAPDHPMAARPIGKSTSLRMMRSGSPGRAPVLVIRASYHKRSAPPLASERETQGPHPLFVTTAEELGVSVGEMIIQ